MVWRTHDAQYWGVPQRRRRISVVADFGGDTASEIQFDRKSVSGDITESGTPGEGFAEAAEAGASYAVRIRGGCDGGGKGALVQTEKIGTLGCGNDQTIFCMATQQGGGDRHGVMCMTPWDAQSQRVYDGNGVSPTLSSRENSCLNREAVGQAHEGAAMTEEVSQTLNTMHDAQAVMCSAVDCRNFTEGGEVNGTLQAKESGGQSLNLNNTVRQNMVVRRLTPMECERLQGFPDHWTDIGEWIDEKGKKHKDADSPRYKALGNSIALPFWEWMLQRMARYLPEDATLGSLFDGIAGFPLIWERIHGKGTARWASEIEQFPIAVTKKWFGEE